MCKGFDTDLDTLVKTGKISDPYLKHLKGCTNCQQKMQTRVLKNIRALENRVQTLETQPIKLKPIEIAIKPIKIRPIKIKPSPIKPPKRKHG